MTNYESNKAAFEKLFTKEELSGGIEKLLPWSYEVNYYYYSDFNTLSSGSKTYYSSETDLHNEAIVRWYHDNENVEGDVTEVVLSLNSIWNKNDSVYQA